MTCGFPVWQSAQLTSAASSVTDANWVLVATSAPYATVTVNATMITTAKRALQDLLVISSHILVFISHLN
jgi:hypothetical protein